MKAVIILSGGMDSGVLLADIIKSKEYEKVYALTFNYGSNHNNIENACAVILASKYNVEEHKIVRLPFFKNILKSSLLEGADKIPEGHYAEESMKQTVVPFRNGIMLSIAAGYADSIGAEELLIGNHAGDHFIYPDCRPAFINYMQDAIRFGTDSEVRLKSPYCHITKKKIGKIGKDLEFDFRMTYTCYKGREKHCGVCGSCTERKEALEGFDTTEYEA